MSTMIQIYEEIEEALGIYMPEKATIYNKINKHARILARRFDFPRAEIVISSKRCCEFDYNIQEILNARPDTDCECKCHQDFKICGKSQANRLMPNWAYECHCPDVPNNLIIFDKTYSENKVWPVNVCCDRIILEVVYQLPHLKRDRDLVWSVENDQGIWRSAFADYAIELIAPLVIRETLANKATQSADPNMVNSMLTLANYHMAGHRDLLHELEQDTMIPTIFEKGGEVNLYADHC